MLRVQNLTNTQSLAPATRNANTNGASVDLSGFMAATVVFNVGAVTDGTHTPSVQESDDNTSFTAVAAGDLGTALVAMTANTPQATAYRGTRRFIRAQVNSSGATGAIYSATIIRGRQLQNDAIS